MANILLAEDDQSMRDFLTLALAKAGHEVTAAEDGLKAIKILESGQSFDLLLTDIVMPGMDGIELAQKAGEHCAEMKVMFITGFAAIAMDRKENSVHKNAKVLSKPFHLNDLVKQVDQLLEVA